MFLLNFLKRNCSVLGTLSLGTITISIVLRSFIECFRSYIHIFALKDMNLQYSELLRPLNWL